jgi:hypothetical protein
MTEIKSMARLDQLARLQVSPSAMVHRVNRLLVDPILQIGHVAYPHLVRCHNLMKILLL